MHRLLRNRPQGISARKTCPIREPIRLLHRPIHRRVSSAISLPPPTTSVIASDRAIAPRGPFGPGGVVTGCVAPGWEDLRAAFEANFAADRELGAQLVVYQRGAIVADLHGHAAAPAHIERGGGAPGAAPDEALEYTRLAHLTVTRCCSEAMFLTTR